MSTINVLENRPCIHIVWRVPASEEATMDAFWKEHEAWMREKHTSACPALVFSTHLRNHCETIFFSRIHILQNSPPPGFLCPPCLPPARSLAPATATPTPAVGPGESQGPNLLHFYIAKGPEMENALAQPPVPTGNLLYVMSETYLDGAQIGQHMEQGNTEKAEWFKQMLEYNEAYGKHMDIGSTVVFTHLDQ